MNTNLARGIIPRHRSWTDKSNHPLASWYLIIEWENFMQPDILFPQLQLGLVRKWAAADRAVVDLTACPLPIQMRHIARSRSKWFFFKHFVGNSGRLNRVRLQQPQEQRYPVSPTLKCMLGHFVFHRSPPNCDMDYRIFNVRHVSDRSCACGYCTKCLTRKTSH